MITQFYTHKLKRWGVLVVIILTAVSCPENVYAQLENFEPVPTVRPVDVNAVPVMGWEISRVFDHTRIDTSVYPRFFLRQIANWKSAIQAEDGRIRFPDPPTNANAELHRIVMLRRSMTCEQDMAVELSFDIAGDSYLYLNGSRVWMGRTGSVSVELKQGLNELFIWAAEDNAQFWSGYCWSSELLPQVSTLDGFLTKAWETSDEFSVPESVYYDESRDMLYVSNFNRIKATTANEGFLSKIGLDGTVIELHWIDGLDGPCGMAMVADHLFVAESTGQIVEIDVAEGIILKRYQIADTTFLNDIATDSEGVIYVTDTTKQADETDIHILKGGSVEPWLTGDEARKANGILYHDGDLIFGNTGDGFLKRVSIETGTIENITCLGGGIIDGIKLLSDGRLIVSHWEGQIYLVDKDGKVHQIHDGYPMRLNAADIEYVGPHHLLIVPTFLGNKVVAYRTVAPQVSVE